MLSTRYFGKLSNRRAGVWDEAFKNKETKLSEATWHFYNRMLEFRKKYVKGKKGKYDKIQAKCVNQIWHADITVFKALNNVIPIIF